MFKSIWLAPDNSPSKKLQHYFAPILLSACHRHIKVLFPALYCLFPSSDLYTLHHANIMAKYRHQLWTDFSATEELYQMFTELLSTKPWYLYLDFICIPTPHRKKDIHLQAKNTFTISTLTSIISGGWLLLYLRFQAIPILPNLSWLRWSLGWFTKLNNTGSFIWNKRQGTKKCLF